MAPFSPTIMEHFLHPRCTGSLSNPDGEGWSGSIRGSRYMRIQVNLAEDRIADARFATYGCAPAIACGSFLCEWAIGKTPAEAVSQTADALNDIVGPLPPARRFCADLAVEALQAALQEAGYAPPDGIDTTGSSIESPVTPMGGTTS